MSINKQIQLVSKVKQLKHDVSFTAKLILSEWVLKASGSHITLVLVAYWSVIGSKPIVMSQSRWDFEGLTFYVTFYVVYMNHVLLSKKNKTNQTKLIIIGQLFELMLNIKDLIFSFTLLWCGTWHSAQGKSVVGQRLHHSYAIIPLDPEDPGVSVNKWQAGGAVSKVNVRKKKTPTNISFMLLLCSLLPHSEVYVTSRPCLSALTPYLA